MIPRKTRKFIIFFLKLKLTPSNQARKLDFAKTMSINSNQFRDLSITSGQDVTVDKSRNYANLFTIKNFDLKELNLTIQYLAIINQDQVGLLTNEPIRDAVLGSKNKLEKLNLRLLKNYYSKDWKNKIKFGMRILYSIISILAVDLVQLYSMEQLSDEIKIKSSFMFGVIKMTHFKINNPFDYCS